jgi:hypothetical protein
VDGIDSERGYCVNADCRPRVTRYEAGTLVVDIVDAKTSRLIWRGWASNSVDGVLDNSNRMRRTIDEGVTRMFSTRRPAR